MMMAKKIGTKKGAVEATSSRKRPTKKVGLKAAPKKRPVKKKQAVARKLAVTKRAEVETPRVAAVQTALMLIEPVPFAVEDIQQQFSLLGEPVARRQSSDMAAASKESFPDATRPR